MNYRDRNIDKKIDKMLFNDLLAVTVRDIQRKHNISSNKKILAHLTFLYKNNMIEMLISDKKTIYRARGSYLSTIGLKHKKYCLKTEVLNSIKNDLF